MGTPHKHAEILRAIADGKTVQYSEFNNGIFVDRPDSYCAKDPITNEYYEWRIKPEPKPDVVRYVGLDPKMDGDAAYIADEECIVRHWHSILKITLDGETGKLKSAEVLK